MSNPESEKSLWEYILLTISVFATLVQLLGLISQSQALLGQPAITVTFVVVVLIGTTIGCVFVLYRRKPGTFTTKILFYTRTQRSVAGGALVTNVVVSAFVLFSVFGRPCISSIAPFSEGKFGILVADFTEGLNRVPTPKGIELAGRTFNALRNRLATSPIGDDVEVRRICAVKTVAEALKAGKSGNAMLVLGGNVAEFAEDTFEPSFTFVNPSISDVNPLLFEVELNRVDSIGLPSKISARAATISAFAIGLIYLREMESRRGYESALRAFSFAITTTESELSDLVVGSEQEVALRRALAIFYVLRGNAYAALNENPQTLNDYSTAEAADPNYSSLYIAKGNYYYALRDFNQAEVEYDKALELSNLATAHYGLGNVFFYTNRYQDSVSAYLKAITLIETEGKDASGVRLILGTVYKLAEQPELAEEELKKVLKSSWATDFQKQQAQYLLAEILNPTPTSVIPLTPKVRETSTLFPTSTALRPTEIGGLPPTDTPLPPPNSQLEETPTLFPADTPIPP
jgi:tetratricopeptide (TPR) repeat protein